MMLRVALAILFVLASASLAHADERVEVGLSQFQDLEFASAITTLREVANDTEASPSKRLLALELIAISHLSLGSGDKARAAFAALLALRPDYELRHHDGSPKVSAVFEEVRRTRRSAPAKAPATADA